MLARYLRVSATPLTPMTPSLAAPQNRALSLVEIIDFKWLMAGDGHRVHVERLQGDPAYACDCLRQGATSKIPALRECARHLAALLNVALPAR